MELRELGGLKTFRKLIKYTDMKRRNSTQALHAFLDQKVFLVVLTDYSMVWYLRAIGNEFALTLSCEIVNQIYPQEDVCG
jgi:hypothetical protein